MKKSHAIIGTAIAFAAGFAIVKSKGDNNTPETENNNNNNNTPAPAPTPNTTTSSDAYPLKQGSKGNNVVKLQRAINDYFQLQGKTNKIGVDGSFGPQTLSACMLIFGLSSVSLNLYNWLVVTNESVRFSKGLNKPNSFIGKKVSLKKDLNLLLYPAFTSQPTTGQSLKLSNGLFVQNSGLTKRFSKFTEFNIAYESGNSVIADFGRIVTPDTVLSNSIFNIKNTSGRYFLILKADLNIL